MVHRRVARRAVCPDRAAERRHQADGNHAEGPERPPHPRVRRLRGHCDPSPQSTWDCAAMLLERGADIQVTEYEGATHTDLPARVYLEGDLLQWLIGGA